MSFSNIQLPVSLVIDLFRKSLIEIPNSGHGRMVPNEGSESRLIEYFGEHRKNIAILVHYEHHQFLPEPELDFLANILKACSMSTTDTALINTATYRADGEAIKRQLAPELMLIFGNDALPVNVNATSKFELTEIGGISTVLVPELHMLNQDNAEGKVYKKQLWAILKKLFKVQ